MPKQGKRIAIKLNKQAQKKCLQGHPWIFENSIIKQSADGEAGDLAIVFHNVKNNFIACGLYDPNSFIRVNILHAGKPVQINTQWFRQTLHAALQKRRNIRTEKTNAFRWIYGGADHLPHLIIDIFSNVLVIKLYSTIWYPYLDEIISLIKEHSFVETIVLRLSRKLQELNPIYEDGTILYGSLENESVHFLEGGALMRANVIRGHKTGFFLDHRQNRIQFASFARGKKVLDVFCYNGGFSVHAATGGAKEIHAIDISKKALADAEVNVNAQNSKATFVSHAGDAFEILEQLQKKKNQFDLIVVDPPSFAKSNAEYDGAIRKYRRLFSLASNVLANKGILLFASCSSRVSSEDFFALVEKMAAQHSLIELQRTGHDIDHPPAFEEMNYLKCSYLQKEK